MMTNGSDRYRLSGGLGTALLLVAVVAIAWFAWAGRTATVEVDRPEAVVMQEHESSHQPGMAQDDPTVERLAGEILPQVDGSELSPVRVGGDVTRPVKISGPNPQYTEIARKGRIQGVVILEAIIDRTGAVRNTRILKPLPMGLDQAAIDAIQQWRFEPAELRGEPVDVYYNLTVNFRLE